MARQGVLERIFPTIRIRLLMILLAAAIPLFLMAASITVQSFQIVVEQSARQPALMLAAGRERHNVETERLARLLAGLAGVPALRESETACADVLHIALVTAPPRGLGLVVLRGDHTPLCGGTQDEGIQPGDIVEGSGEAGRWWAAASGLARAGQPPVFRFTEARGQNGLPSLTAAVALSATAGGGTIAGRVVVNWLAAHEIGGSLPGTATWLQIGDGPLAPLDAAVSQADMPDAARLARLLRREGLDRIDVASSGHAYSYDATELGGGARLVVGVPATTDLARADALLGRRMVELGVVLAIGLVAMALGAYAAVVRPIKHLSRAVEVWRNGGGFDRIPADGAPREVVELATTFSEATTALRGREAQLQEAGRRQELLMQEIHHRVKNNLQIIASLLNLQASRIRLPEARAEFQAARDRIRALATLHRHLYSHGELHQIDMRLFLVELCGQLLQALGETPAGGRIRLDIEAPPLQLSSDQAVPLALIVTEAVSNAAKYAFPGGRSGHITVRVERLDGGAEDGARRVRLVITDDGVGIPAGRAETEAGVRDGLGIQLIRGFARQLGATLEVVQDSGTRYVLEMALQPERSEPPPLVEESADAAQPLPA